MAGSTPETADAALPLEDLQLCISPSMAGQGKLVRELRELGATVKCGVVSNNTTHCLATPQELGLPTRECAQSAARTIPIVHASFAVACINSRRLVAWQDHQLVAQLPIDPTNVPAMTESRARSEPSRAEDAVPAARNADLSEDEDTQATLPLPELGAEDATADQSMGHSDESDAESEDMFAEDRFSATGALPPSDEVRTSESSGTFASADPETIPFDDDGDDDSTEGEDDESSAVTDSSGAANGGHVIDSLVDSGTTSDEDSVTTPVDHGTPLTQPAAMSEAQEDAVEGGGGEHAGILEPTSPDALLPDGVVAADVDACVSMGLDRHKSIGWLYACQLEEQPLTTALEWLLDEDDYDPPPILTRQQSAQKVHEMMGGELSIEACEAELGPNPVDIDACVDRLMKKLAKQAKSQKKAKQRQQPDRATRHTTRHSANSAGHPEASSQEAAQAPATHESRAGGDGLRQKRRSEEVSTETNQANKRAKAQAGIARKDNIELHKRTTEEEVMRRCPGAFEWIHRAAQIQPSAEVAKQYPRIQCAWEQLTDADVINMTRKRWLRTDKGPKLCDQPIYLGWLQSADHPACKYGKSRGRPDLEIGVFAQETIEKGEEVLSYVGRPVSSKDSSGTAGPDRDSGAYAQLWQPANSCFDIEIDAAVCRNAGPMVNDFRDNVNSPRSANTSSRNANLIPRHKYWKVPASAKGSVGSGFPLIIFEAKRRICKGEELLWDYGIGYWETRNNVEEVEDEANEHQDTVPSLRQTDDADDSDVGQSQVF